MLLGGAAAGAVAVPARAPGVAAAASAASPYERRVIEIAIASSAAASLGQSLAERYSSASPISRCRRGSRACTLSTWRAARMRSFLLSHGKGSDPEHDGWLKHFSGPARLGGNLARRLSHQRMVQRQVRHITAAGRSRPGKRTALERHIVIHPAWYAEADMIGKWGKLGRSSGCFALGHRDYADTLDEPVRRAAAVCRPHRRGLSPTGSTSRYTVVTGNPCQSA